MLSINNLLILLILFILITNVKLDLGGPCFSMSTMEGFACGLGVHKTFKLSLIVYVIFQGIGNNSMDVIN